MPIVTRLPSHAAGPSLQQAYLIPSPNSYHLSSVEESDRRPTQALLEQIGDELHQTRCLIYQSSGEESGMFGSMENVADGFPFWSSLGNGSGAMLNLTGDDEYQLEPRLGLGGFLQVAELMPTLDEEETKAKEHAEKKEKQLENARRVRASKETAHKLQDTLEDADTAKRSRERRMPMHIVDGIEVNDYVQPYQSRNGEVMPTILASSDKQNTATRWKYVRKRKREDVASVPIPTVKVAKVSRSSPAVNDSLKPKDHFDAKKSCKDTRNITTTAMDGANSRLQSSAVNSAGASAIVKHGLDEVNIYQDTVTSQKQHKPDNLLLEARSTISIIPQEPVPIAITP